MKELKLSLTNEIAKGFTELNQLFIVYKFHLENGKQKDEDLDTFFFEQMETLKSLCVSHLTKIQSEGVRNINSWKKKKEEQEQ